MEKKVVEMVNENQKTKISVSDDGNESTNFNLRIPELKNENAHDREQRILKKIESCCERLNHLLEVFDRINR